MAVRRLAETQPESFAFTQDNQAWARTQIAKFPEGRQASAVISLLWRAQEQEGWVTKPAIEKVAEILEMPTIRVLEVATFYTMFHLEPVGRKAHVQVCGTTPCMLAGSDDIIEVCRKRIHEHPHHLSADGDFSWEEVECVGACVNAPMVQIWSDTYEDLTRGSFEAVLDGFASGAPPAPGPQNGRQYSAPITGQTTLTDIQYDSEDVPRRKPDRSPARSEGSGAAASLPPPSPDGKAEVSGGEQRQAEVRRRSGEPVTAGAGGADPAGAATEGQEIARVDPTGRSDDAAARARGDAPGRPAGHAAKVETSKRSGEDKAAQPRSNRDSSTGDREG